MAEHGLPDAVSELLGQPSGAPTAPAVSPGAGGTSSPPVPAEPAQQGPSAGRTAQGLAVTPNGVTLPDLPVITNSGEVIETFYRQHGRRPSEPELRAIRALPMLQRQLGRRPTKAELLSFLDSRNETKPAMPPQFIEGGPAEQVSGSS